MLIPNDIIKVARGTNAEIEILIDDTTGLDDFIPYLTVKSHYNSSLKLIDLEATTFDLVNKKIIFNVPYESNILSIRDYYFDVNVEHLYSVLTIDVPPADDWEAGDIIEGQVSGATCKIVSKTSDTVYKVVDVVGTYNDAEEIGVRSAIKITNQGVGFPITTLILTISNPPVVDWAPADIITGQTSGETCEVVNKISDTQYEVINSSGLFYNAEEIGVTGDSDKLVKQKNSFPQLNLILTIDTAPLTAWSIGDTIEGRTSGATSQIVRKISNLEYEISNLIGTYNDGEKIGAIKMATQGAGYPDLTKVPLDGIYKRFPVTNGIYRVNPSVRY